MKHIFSKVTLTIGLILAFLLTTSLSIAQDSIDINAIDSFIQSQLQANGIPGVALAITYQDRVVYLQGYGDSITSQTQFFIASLTKSFTAVAVMQLVDAGQIDLDTPVKTYLSEFTTADPALSDQITIRQLLNQVSGLSDSGFPEGRLPQPSTTEERVTSLSSAQVVSEPGSEFHYFNPNYGILARIVEVVSGQSISDYLQAHVFTPLEMTNTFNALTSTEAMQNTNALAQGHLMVYGLPVAMSEMSGYLGGSGGMISTAEDMANYLIFQNGNGQYGGETILSEASLNLMHTPPAGVDSNYAMGWMQMSENGVQTIEHNGILSAFYAEMVLLPDSEYGVALLYNVNSLPDSFFAFPSIKQGVIALLTGGQPPQYGFTVRYWGIFAAVLTLVGGGLALRSLLRLSHWRERNASTAGWRLLPGIVWTITPAVVVAALPWLVVLTSGRAFSYEQLFRYMPDISLWLAICAVLGIINALMRIAFLLRRSRV